MKKFSLSITFICLVLLPALGQLPKPDTLKMSIFFDFGEYELRPESKEDIHFFCQKVLNQNAYRVYIQGNTDDKGSEEWNQTLSRNRCIAVENQLIVEGMSQAFFEKVTALGELFPIAENDNETNRQKNRRVDVLAIYNYPQLTGIEKITPWIAFSPSAQTFIFHPLPVIASTFKMPKIATEKEEVFDIDEELTEREIEIKPKEESLADYLFKLSCQNQTFTLDATVEHIITMSGGTQLYIPADAFDIEGNNKMISLQIQEFTEKGNMILAGLNTQNDDNIIETGGMINLEASNKNGKVKLKKGKKLIGLFRTRGAQREGMRLFSSLNLGKNWNMEEESPELKDLHLTTYHKEWGLPNASTESLQNLHTKYCEVCDEGIHYQDDKESITKSFSIFGFSLFKYKSKVSKKAKASRWKRFIHSERQRRKKFLQENQFEDCPSMKAALMAEIQTQPQFTDWYLNLYPNMKKYFELLRFIKKNKADYYVISGIKLGWGNCDRFLDYPELITLKIEEESTENKIIRVALKNDNVTLQPDALMPKDQTVYIIGVKRENQKLYLSLQETQSDSELKKLVWEEVGERELVTRINAINPS